MQQQDADRTRLELLRSAFAEMHAHGYAGASLERILAHTGLTKGALYYHFGSKTELGLAVIDELVRDYVRQRWIVPMMDTDDPLTRLVEISRMLPATVTPDEIRLGCPLNNLVQELSGAEEAFRDRLADVLLEWRAGFADALRRGQEAGNLRADVDCEALATLLVASFEGLAGTVKNARSVEAAAPAANLLFQLLEGLRPSSVRGHTSGRGAPGVPIVQ